MTMPSSVLKAYQFFNESNGANFMTEKLYVVDKEIQRDKSEFVSSDVFREAMSRLSAPVALVTTDGPAGRYGLTVSAICSVSVEPPTVLVCLNRDNRSHAAFLRNGVIGISILEPGHEELAFRFASSKTDQNEKFLGADWVERLGGAPVLTNAAVTLVGRIAQTLSSGSHDILVAHIHDIGLHTENTKGLVWFDRAFHHLPAQT